MPHSTVIKNLTEKGTPPTIEVFPWNDNFETGLSIIDSQHKKLVELINELASLLAHADEDKLQKIFDELTDYANYHFETEEKIWTQHLETDDWYQDHRGTHKTFLPTIQKLQEANAKKPFQDILEDTVKYLIQWLAYHILKDDMQLASLVKKLENGTPIEQAKTEVLNEISDTQELFVETVLQMYNSLSSRTFELMREKVLNEQTTHALQIAQASLEGKVQERTKSLQKEIEQHRETERDLNKLLQAIEQSPSSVVITDVNGCIQYANPRFCNQTGFELHELEGNVPSLIQNAIDHPIAFQDMWTSLKERNSWSGEIKSQHKDGSTFWENVTISPIKDEHGNIIQYLGLREDITAKKEYEERLYKEANFHPLTSLPNRNNIENRTQKLIDQQENFTVICVDLLDVDIVNSSLGYDCGDQIIQTAAQRLNKLTSNHCVLGHWGGDIFVFLNRDPQRLSTELLISQINKAFDSPIQVAEEIINQRCNIGIARYPGDAENAHDLLNNARQAINRAKSKGIAGYAYYTQSQNKQSRHLLHLESELSQALEKGELHVYYQPKVDALSGAFLGAEALLRWISDKRGMISPTEFIPLAEHKGLIIPIGNWVLKQACQQARNLLTRGIDDFSIAVNVSPIQFADGRFVELLEKHLSENDIEGKYLEIEVTEGLLMEANSQINAEIEALKLLGVSLALDDFGTGYSSLSYMRNFPFTTLKIDQAFVRNLEHSISDADLVRAIISMGQSFSKKIVAEGVETIEQADFLRKEGCGVFQGYLYGKPMPTDEFKNWVSEHVPHSSQQH